MTDDLIERLKTCPAKERKAVAKELAQSGTDESVLELIRMVKGGRRRRLSWYNLEDQLIGIDVLGETKSKVALNYLRKLNVTVEESEVEKSGHNGWNNTTYLYETYPHARGKLYGKLKRLTNVSTFTHAQLSYNLQDYVESSPGEPKSKAHKILEGSIKQLEKNLKKSSD